MSFENNIVDIKIKVINPKVYEYGLPKYSTEGSAGTDLHACLEEPITLSPGE